MMKKTRLACAALALSALLLLCACAPKPLPPLEGPETTPELSSLPVLSSAAPVLSSGALESPVTPAWQEKGERPYSAWAVYWDAKEVCAELLPFADKLGILSYFEAFFLEDGSLFAPEELDALRASVEAYYPDHAWKNYITFVNDLRKADGSFSLKDAKMLAPLFASEAAMDAHIQELLDFTLAGGYDGLEIDYEALRKAPELWEPFAVFCGRLYARTQEAKLGLRIILEPGAPVNEYVFPEGPEYVIMCYNLHGGHSDPGPKADYAFLSSLMQQAEHLPGETVFALATGGYDWSDNENAAQLTTKRAYTVYRERGRGSTVRDGESGALAFRYDGEDGKLHTVWFADMHTLALWSQHLKRAGHTQLAFWRLGGNYYD